MLYPEFPDTFWSFKHALAFVDKSAGMPPLGLLTVAAMLPAEWDLRLVDMNVARLTDADLAWADCVFVSAMVVQRECDRGPRIRRCKAAGLPVVAGGPLFTAEHEDFPEVDHFVLNEAELTLPPFLADFARGRSAARLRHRPSTPTCTTTPAAALGPGRPEALCDDRRPVLAGLPVRLRVLQHHGPLRPPPARQDRAPRSSPSSTSSIGSAGAAGSSSSTTT